MPRANSQDHPPRGGRPWWLSLLLYAFVVVGIVAARGHVLAYLTAGRYRFVSLVIESVALGGLIAGLRLFDFGVRFLLRTLIPRRRLWQRVVARSAYAAILLVVGGPFIIATIYFHPQRISCGETPKRFALDYRAVTFESSGRTLSGWFIPTADETAPIVLVAHGLNANKDNFLYPAFLLQVQGFAVFIFDFPGHGDSEGWTVTFGARERLDVKAAYDWIVREHPSRPVHALGYSMGGAAVMRAAAEYDIFERIVIDSSFTSAERVARAKILWPLGPLAGPCWRLGCIWGRLWSGVDIDTHRPGDRIAEVAKRPLLLIHGTQDGTIPHTESIRLHEATGGKSELWLVEGAGHVEAMIRPGYGARLAEFFGRPEKAADTDTEADTEAEPEADTATNTANPDRDRDRDTDSP